MRPHLYKRPCPSVGWLVGWSVRPSVMLSSKSVKNGLLRILNDLDSAGRGGRRDKEERGTRREEGGGGWRNGEEGGTGRKEERGGRRDEEREKMKKFKEKMTKGKVARGRIFDPRGLVFL